MSPLEALNSITMAFDEDEIVSLSWKEVPKQFEWQVTVIFSTEPNSEYWQQYLTKYCRVLGLATPEMTVTKVEEKNWLTENAKLFAPFTVGRFYVHSSEYEGNTPKDTLPLVIGAATAFGSGHHETTQGCLSILDKLPREPYAKKPYHLLDMGTGSGILGIAAAKIWDHLAVTAVDCDPEAIRVCVENVERNGVGDSVRVFVSDRVLLKGVRGYDIIVANILAQPLLDLASQFYGALCSQGFLILSGLLNEQSQSIIQKYIPMGLTMCEHHTKGEWSTLLLKKIS
ncbi:MAG: 50S ribosomal protein L11 methyltransferase [Alphaproteobacteria bacterium]|nr:MAG: 50S ribosomal protein L11 methyltransferase [Alphaproteobacteria bacterium]